MSTATATPIKAWLTSTEAAEIMGKQRATLWRWAHTKIIPRQHLLKVGNHVYIARAWVMGGAL